MVMVRRRLAALGVALAIVAGLVAAPVTAEESPQAELGRLRSVDADLEAQLDDIGLWLRNGRARLSTLETEIEATQVELEAARASVARAQDRVDRQQARVERRAVAAYIRPVGIADLALSSDVGLAAEQRALVSQVTSYDRDLLEAKQEVEDRLEAEREAAADARRDLEDARAGVLDLMDRIDEQRVEAEQARLALDARIEAVQAEVDAMSASSGGLADLINDLSSSSGDGVARLLLPVDGTLTSRFGPRWGRLHAGIDIAASTGTPIHAAAAGRTIYSGWMSGYGNVVIVDHGGGLSSLYAHQSNRRTRVGDRLDRGEILGEVGSTGNSTGAHLHFEVRERGSPVDPIPYLAR